MGEPRVSGAIVRDQLEVYEQRVGAQVLAEARAALPEDQRVELEGVLPIGWVRLATYNAFLIEVAQRSGRELLAMDAEAMRRGVEHTFSTLWRVLLRLTSDEALVTRTPTFYSKAFDTGRLTARITTPGRAELVLTDYPDISDVDLQGVRISAETVLRLAGRKDVHGTQRRTETGGVFHITFRK